MVIAMWATTIALLLVTIASQGVVTQRRYTRQVSPNITTLTWSSRFNEGRRLKVSGDVTNHVRKRYIMLGDYKPDQAYQSCIMPGEQRGRCRHLQYCVLEDFRTSFPRFLDYLCIIERSFVGVCCPDRPDQGGGGFLPASSPTGQESSSVRLAGESKTKTGDGPMALLPSRLQPRGCGVGSRSDIRRTDGKTADPKEWPWMAALLRDGDIQYCGAVLISDRHVLTAAHCVSPFQAADIRVRLGEYDLKTPEETRFRDFRVTNIKQHEDFQKTTYENDIAILTLHRPATFNTYIWPICLPPPDETFENQTATVIGWGTLYFGGPASNVLMEVTVPVLTNDECDPKYTQVILDTVLCAGFEDKDACQGDSGGPLLFQLANKRWVTIGVVSWGIRCGEPERPGIYTRVTRYLSWINKNSIF